MAFIKRFWTNTSNPYIKIYHKTYRNFHTIGIVLEENPELNIAKVRFTDADGKKQEYWFHLFTGMVVTLPKKKGEFAKDVPFDSKDAYALSSNIVRVYDLDPTADINYKAENDDDDEENKTTKIEKIELENRKNKSVRKLH